MNMLHVFLPPLTHASTDPAFRAWLARGDRLPEVAGARASVLREWFHFAGPLPTAALRHCARAGRLEPGVWLCADPAYVRSEATGARLMACPLDYLTADEAAQLAVTLGPLLDEVGASLAVDASSAWNLHLTGDAPLAEFVSPADALGVDMLACLPRGDSGRAWRRLFNEVQIALHTHPLNAARAAAGKLPVNALWFWGAGALPDSSETGLRWVASTDDVVRGLARMAAVGCVEPSEAALQAVDHAGEALLDLESSVQANVAQWLPCFRAWLRERRFDEIDIVFAGGERFRVRHAHRLRLWRRA